MLPFSYLNNEDNILFNGNKDNIPGKIALITCNLYMNSAVGEYIVLKQSVFVRNKN